MRELLLLVSGVVFSSACAVKSPSRGMFYERFHIEEIRTYVSRQPGAERYIDIYLRAEPRHHARERVGSLIIKSEGDGGDMRIVVINDGACELNLYTVMGNGSGPNALRDTRISYGKSEQIRFRRNSQEEFTRFTFYGRLESCQ